MKVVWPLCAVLLVAGCHDAPLPTQPSPVDPPRPVVLPAVCTVPAVIWSIDVDMSAPRVTVTSRPTVASLELEELNGTRWEPIGRDLHFEHRYRVRGLVSGCLPAWFEFAVGTPGTAPSGPLPKPVPPMPVPPVPEPPQCPSDVPRDICQ